MARAFLILVPAIAACAARSKPAEVPAAVAPASVATPDAGEGVPSSHASTMNLFDSDRDEPTYGELMRGERIGSGPVAQAEMRRWIRPLRTLDASACPPAKDDLAAFHDCWCGLVCGVRFEARPSTIQIRYPYAEVDGPGFEVAPDGHVTKCWHTGRGARETHVMCAAR